MWILRIDAAVNNTIIHDEMSYHLIIKWCNICTHTYSCTDTKLPLLRYYLSQRFTVECLVYACATIISIFVAICSIVKTQKDSIVTMRSISFVITIRHSFGRECECMCVCARFFLPLTMILLLGKASFIVCFVFDFNTSTEHWIFINNEIPMYRTKSEKKAI